MNMIKLREREMTKRETKRVSERETREGVGPWILVPHHNSLERV